MSPHGDTCWNRQSLLDQVFRNGLLDGYRRLNDRPPSLRRDLRGKRNRFPVRSPPLCPSL